MILDTIKIYRTLRGGTWRHYTSIGQIPGVHVSWWTRNRNIVPSRLLVLTKIEASPMRTKLLKRFRKRFNRHYHKGQWWYVYDTYSGDSISSETTHAAVYFMASYSLPGWRIAKWIRKVLNKNGGWGKHTIKWRGDFTYFDK